MPRFQRASPSTSLDMYCHYTPDKGLGPAFGQKVSQARTAHVLVNRFWPSSAIRCTKEVYRVLTPYYCSMDSSVPVFIKDELPTRELHLCHFGRGRGGLEEDMLEGSTDGAALSEREKEVLTLLAMGESNPSIAKQLHLSPETIRNYTRMARLKLGARSRSHAIAIAALTGQLDKDKIIAEADSKD